MEHIPAIIEKLLSLQAPLLVPIFIATAILTFSPFGLRDKIGLSPFHDTYHEVISLVFLYSVSCLLSRGITIVSRALKRRRNKHSFLERMNDLSQNEIEIVALLYGSQSGAEWLPFENEAVMNLINKEILMLQAKNVIPIPKRDYLPCVLCALHPLVRDKIRKEEMLSQEQQKD